MHTKGLGAASMPLRRYLAHCGIAWQVVSGGLALAG